MSKKIKQHPKPNNAIPSQPSSAAQSPASTTPDPEKTKINQTQNIAPTTPSPQSETKTNNTPTPTQKLKATIGTLTLIAGTIFLTYHFLGGELLRFIERNLYLILGAFALAVSFRIRGAELQKALGLGGKSFIDVDDADKRHQHQDAFQRLAGEIKTLKETVSALKQDLDGDDADDTDLADEAILDDDLFDLDDDNIDFSQKPAETFVEYFYEMKQVLEEKASNADRKASILLDRGVAYSRFGIAFYVISIITWQALFWWRGFQAYLLYGIASCSILFVFIEVLSAWFLKQYRHFVDTSTYLIKVKALFDRYMLTFMALGDKTLATHKENGNLDGFLSMLKDEIKWPESYLLKTGDANLTIELMDSLTKAAHALREKDKKDSKN